MRTDQELQQATRDSVEVDKIMRALQIYNKHKHYSDMLYIWVHDGDVYAYIAETYVSGKRNEFHYIITLRLDSDYWALIGNAGKDFALKGDLDSCWALWEKLSIRHNRPNYNCATMRRPFDTD